MANSALLTIAGVLQNVKNAIVDGDGTQYDKQEVIVLCLQALIQILCGGSPSSIVLPNIQSAAGANDAAIARFCSGAITASPFIPGGANFATKTAVAADGGTTPVTFTNAFPNGCSAVLCQVRDYSGSDNAALVWRTSSLSKTGFSVTVGGGASGSTCSVDYFPVGT